MHDDHRMHACMHAQPCMRLHARMHQQHARVTAMHVRLRPKCEELSRAEELLVLPYS
eukprot:COSAG02_NODE_2734_length_8135_cov_185.067446_3_plen_57_part_00